MIWYDIGRDRQLFDWFGAMRSATNECHVSAVWRHHAFINHRIKCPVGRSFTLQYATPIEYCISICWRGVVVLREACLVWEPWPPVPRLLYLLIKAPVCDWSIVDVVVYDRVSRRHGLTSDFVTLRALVFQPHLSSSSSVFLFFRSSLPPPTTALRRRLFKVRFPVHVSVIIL